MALARVVCRQVHREKVVNVDLSRSDRNQVASVRELQLIASFVAQVHSVFQSVCQNVHELDFVSESYNDVKPGRMESNSSWGLLLVLVLFTDFELLGPVVPNLYMPGACGHDKFLSNTNIHARDCC